MRVFRDPLVIVLVSVLCLRYVCCHQSLVVLQPAQVHSAAIADDVAVREGVIDVSEIAFALSYSLIRSTTPGLVPFDLRSRDVAMALSSFPMHCAP